MGTETQTKCKAHDPINRLLLHEVAKYVYYDTLVFFASDLGVEHAKITTPNMFYVNEQIYQVGATRNISISLNKEGTRDVCPPLSPSSFTFMQVFGNKIAK